ncbi:MAG: hypothetical protein LBB88_11885, partial [Planctomycetaceae bacterium]|nr:hypothetical protein [Planctomycetaceae bacterium]
MKKLIIILVWLNLFFVLLFCACNRSEESIEPKPPIEQTNDPSSNSNLKNPSTMSVVVTNGGDSDVVKEKYNFRYKFQTGDIFRWNVVQQLKV